MLQILEMHGLKLAYSVPLQLYLLGGRLVIRLWGLLAFVLCLLAALQQESQRFLFP